MNKFFASSTNPEELSMTIKGFLTMIVPVAGMILKLIGHQIDDATLNAWVEQLGNIVITLGTLVSSFMMLWGQIRKAWHGI